MVKVIHLATSLKGGAGNAARRLNNALIKSNVDSKILSLGGTLPDLKSSEVIIKRNINSSILSSALTASQSLLVQSGKELVTTFSLNSIKKSIPEILDADILHVHAYYNLLSNKSLEKLLDIGPSIFFTLHDQRLFTGGCHYSLACTGFMDACQNCPQVRKNAQPFVARTLQKEIEIFAKNSQINFISPSQWLADLAVRSKVLNGKKITVLKNPIPLIYKQQNHRSGREKYNLHKDQFVLAFSSVNLNNPYKGLRYFILALNEMAKNGNTQNLHILFLGNGEINNLDSRIKCQKISVESDLAMSEILSIVDLLVVPSTQENSPSIIGEALMTGTQVTGSNVGGIVELLEPFSSPIFESSNPKGIADVISNFDTNYSRSSIANRARIMFSEELIGESMRKLYSQALIDRCMS